MIVVIATKLDSGITITSTIIVIAIAFIVVVVIVALVATVIAANWSGKQVYCKWDYCVGGSDFYLVDVEEIA